MHTYDGAVSAHISRTTCWGRPRRILGSAPTVSPLGTRTTAMIPFYGHNDMPQSGSSGRLRNDHIMVVVRALEIVTTLVLAHHLVLPFFRLSSLSLPPLPHLLTLPPLPRSLRYHYVGSECRVCILCLRHVHSGARPAPVASPRCVLGDREVQEDC